MSHRLDSAWAKLGRAHEYLNVLEEQTRPFTHAQPDEVVIEFDSHTSEHVFRLNVKATIRKEEWGLLIGDCVHNARCALDHATWQLAELCSGVTFHDTRTQFPIFADQKLFQVAAPRMLWRIHSNGRTVIEGLQPFKRSHPEDEPLWLLHTLDIADKHRYLVPVLHAFSGLRYWFVSDERYRIDVSSGHLLPGPVKDNAEFGRIKATNIRDRDGNPVRDPQMKVEGAPGLTIALEDWVLGRPGIFVSVFMTLSRSLMEVGNVLRHFDAHFQREFGLPPIVP